MSIEKVIASAYHEVSTALNDFVKTVKAPLSSLSARVQEFGRQTFPSLFSATNTPSSTTITSGNAPQPAETDFPINIDAMRETFTSNWSQTVEKIKIDIDPWLKEHTAQFRIDERAQAKYDQTLLKKAIKRLNMKSIWGDPPWGSMSVKKACRELEANQRKWDELMDKLRIP